ncbi:hypothetical protein [Halalkalicoccus jeotgali]|uniref:Tail sheath protein C-terminal domain-containing protein n=1 Tax=Halalkalicoccus jeotgali (strain DSM 18796 / CECT 7217 / JCM 14584 / KCTC 4019 / B3) TaxID=795797 RepID=D8J9V2_HALJB|nr:hypothetical protein [Halalkalicoccus jeotgali]ADJ14474.1 hypothetical protein HacjB3_05415 [Halalkalicoccus jeotgali B3]ELY40188.1 hypothetical protein C497_03790 [Halalkalicoccus jeotgali B3]
MPRIDNAVSFTVEEEFAASPRDTLQEVALIGSAPTAEEPTAGFNSLSHYTDASAVADDFGEDSDVHTAAMEVFGEGTEMLRAMVLEASEHTETFGAAEATDTAQVENTPITGLEDVTVTIDDTDAEVVDVISAPPDITEAEERREESVDAPPLAALNRDTGELTTDTETSGTGTGIEITYSTLPWRDAFDELESVTVDIIDLANHRYGYHSIGDMDELGPWMDAEEVMRVQPYVNGQTFDRPEEGLALAHEVGGYAPSKWVLPMANESPTDGLGGRIAGLYSTNDVDYNIIYKSIAASVPNNTRYTRLIGDVGLSGTFEGGDEGSGPSNVLEDDGGVYATNSLTTAGIEDDYRYLDRTRRVAYAKNRAKLALQDLLRSDDRSFDQYTKTDIEQAIEEEFADAIGGRNAMFTSVGHNVPEPEDTAREERANRIWENIELLINLNEPVHRMSGTIRATL